MNFTYVLGFVVLRDVIKVFPVSSSSFARKMTGRNRARSHSGGMTRPKRRNGISNCLFRVRHISSDTSLSKSEQQLPSSSPTLSSSDSSGAWIFSHFRIQVRPADECVAPGRRQFRETSWTSDGRLSSPETNLKVGILPLFFMQLLLSHMFLSFMVRTSPLSFFLGFLFLLRAKKPQNNENISGSTSPSRHNDDFFPFTEAKILDKGLSATCDGRVDSDAGILEGLCTWQNGHRDKFCCYRGRLHDLGRSSDNFENRIEHCFWDGGHPSSSFSVFRKDETDFDARGDTAIARVLVCFQPPGRLPFRRVWSRTMESWASATVSDIHGSYRYTLHMYHRQLSPDLADARWPWEGNKSQ